MKFSILGIKDPFEKSIHFINKQMIITLRIPVIKDQYGKCQIF